MKLHPIFHGKRGVMLRARAAAGEVVPCQSALCRKEEHPAQWIMFPTWAPSAVCDDVKEFFCSGDLTDDDFEPLTQRSTHEENH